MNASKIGPIGVFDSGYGGLTILKELKLRLPEYDYLYLGDNARTPYGTRSFEVVYQFTLEAVEELFDRGCSLVILACNTASAKALRSIQMNDLPKMAPGKRVLGVIRPSSEFIGSLSKSRHVGILATPGTVKSKSYSLELAKFYPDLTVTEYACPMWVPLIENNKHNSVAGQMIMEEDLNQILNLDPKIDTLVLACTHYPLVQDFLQEKAPENVQIVAQGKIVADSLADYLIRHPEMDELCSKSGKLEFLTTENVSFFDENASVFFGQEVHSKHIDLGS
jgi:glutamate racemase